MEFALIVVFITYAFKHFIADFVLQNHYMLGKFKPYPGFFLPLSAHCAVHALGVGWLFIVAGLNARELSDITGFFQLMGLMMVYEFASHFLVDVVKAQWTRITKANHTEHRFWVAIGIDQLAHVLFSIPVIVAIAFVLSEK